MSAVTAEHGQRAEMLAVHIRGYKNLAPIDLPWHRVGVLFGPNGAGKTNILECLALLFGTDRTLHLIRDRALLPEPGHLRCTVSLPGRRLPLPPDIARRLANVSDLSARATADMRWWEELGATTGATVSEALSQTSLPQPHRDVLIAASVRPTVRYTLAAMHDYCESARIFEPEWILPTLTDELLRMVDAASGTPSALRLVKDSTDGTVIATLPLPSTVRGPARLEWLAHPRSSADVTEDLIEVFTGALPNVARIAELIGWMITSADVDPDPSWWLHQNAARRADRELHDTIGNLGLRSSGEDDATWTVTVGSHDLASTRDPHFLSQLSSAERRWADEALASASRAIEDQGRRSQWQHFFWSQVENAMDGPIIEELTGGIAAAVMKEGYVSGDVLERVAELLDTQLVETAREWLAGDRARSEMTLALMPTIADLAEPPLTVRVFDEPEAHLHPTGQRRVRDALTSMGRGGEDVIISTHSPYLLNQREWTYTKVIAGCAAPLTDDDLSTSDAFAAQMGLTTGELLATTRLILVVEGKHDEYLLRELYNDDLRDAGVAIVPMHGTWNAMSLLESEFWLRYSGVPFSVMFDNTRLDALDSTLPDDRLRPEERALRVLHRTARERGRKIRRIGLTRPDITAYLAEDLFRDRPSFPGWATVVDRYRADRASQFKQYVRNNYGISLSTHDVERYVDQMRIGGLRPEAELERKVLQVCASATEQAPQPDPRP
jgi:hypothetical protein